MSTAMTNRERESFLAEVHVGVLSVNHAERGPLSIPIWYAYHPGEDLLITTGANSRKGRLLKDAKRMGFCVQDETPPYRYVSIEGPITIEDSDPEGILEDTRKLAHRYLGVEAGDAYVVAQRDFFERSGPMRVRFKPERWLTFDASKEAL